MSGHTAPGRAILVRLTAPGTSAGNRGEYGVDSKTARETVVHLLRWRRMGT
ncbi:MAG: hypothetical protein ACXVA4_12565 [Ktedonobacterales bacterium]